MTPHDGILVRPLVTTVQSSYSSRPRGDCVVRRANTYSGNRPYLRLESYLSLLSYIKIVLELFHPLLTRLELSRLGLPLHFPPDICPFLAVVLVNSVPQ